MRLCKNKSNLRRTQKVRETACFPQAWTAAQNVHGHRLTAKPLLLFFLIIFISKLTLYRLKQPAAASTESNTWQLTARLNSKAAAQTLQSHPAQRAFPRLLSLQRPPNLWKPPATCSKGLILSVGCSQAPQVIGGKSSRRFWPGGPRQQGPSSGGAPPADLHGAARRVSVHARSYGTLTGEKVVEVSSSGFLDFTFDRKKD